MSLVVTVYSIHQDLQQVMVSGPNLNETSIVSGGYGGPAGGIIPTSSIKGTVRSKPDQMDSSALHVLRHAYFHIPKNKLLVVCYYDFKQPERESSRVIILCVLILHSHSHTYDLEAYGSTYERFPVSPRACSPLQPRVSGQKTRPRIRWLCTLTSPFILFKT